MRFLKVPAPSGQTNVLAIFIKFGYNKTSKVMYKPLHKANVPPAVAERRKGSPCISH